LTFHTDISKPICQVTQPAAGVALNASSCGPCFKTEAGFTCDLVTLTFRPLNGVKGRPCHGLPSCQFSASYTLPCST